MGSSSSTPRAHIGFALICTAIAGLLTWAAATGHPGLEVPPAVAYVAAGVHALAALRLIQLAIRPESPGDGFGALIIGGLAGVGGWIAFGAGERICTAGVSGLAIGESVGLGCRVPFGIGAVLAGAIALYAGWRWARGLRRGPDLRAGAE